MDSGSLIEYTNDFVIGADLAEPWDDGTEGYQERLIYHPTVKREGSSSQVVHKSKLTVRAKGLSPTYLATIANPHHPEASSGSCRTELPRKITGMLRIGFTAFQQPKYHYSSKVVSITKYNVWSTCLEVVPTVQVTPGIWIRPLPTMSKL